MAVEPNTLSIDAVPILKDIDSTVPFILTADKNSREPEIKVCRQDIFYYFTKPFGSDEIRSAISEGFKNRKRRPGQFKNDLDLH